MHLKTTLNQIGLNDRHATIYLACLELGSASVLHISRKSGFARSTCEAVLQSLQKKGFVFSFKKKTIRYWSPEEPQKLVSLARSKVEILEQAIPQFSARYFRGGLLPTARVYEGETGAALVFQEILGEAKELTAFGSIDGILDRFPDFFRIFTAARVSRGIPLKLILQDSPLARERQKSGPQEQREIRLLSSGRDYTGIIYLWEDKLAMFALKEKVIVFVIESSELAEMWRALFDTVWPTLTEPPRK